MKFRKILSFFLVVILINTFLVPAFAQMPDLSNIKEMIKEAQDKAKDTKDNSTVTEPAMPVELAPLGVSAIENIMTTGAPGAPTLSQFGYDIFRQSTASFAPRNDIPVRANYIIGSGDSLNITLWGINEGVIRVTVDREGNITLPKAGVVSVAGLRFGNLENFIASALNPYYQQINVSVSMGKMRSMDVYVLGEVVKPGRYVLSPVSSSFNALYACGGPTKMGSLRNIKLVRYGRTIARIDLYDFLLYGKNKGDIQLQDGDTIFVPLIGDVVGIGGNVYRPAIYEIRGKASLKDIIDVAGGLMPTSYLNRVQLQRIVAHERKVVEDINISDGNSSLARLKLKNMDVVQVFPIFPGVSNLVYLEGEVKYPGTYELKEGMTVKDLIPSINAVCFNSYLDQAELVRIDPYDKSTFVLQFSLTKLFSGDESQNLVLQSMDRVVVYSEKKDAAKVTISGHVKVPGTYYINKGEKLSSLIRRAGGFSDDAFLYGVVFTRKSAKSNQQSSLNKMIDELQRRMIVESSLRVNSPEEMQVANERYNRATQLLEQLKKTQAQGRVIVNLDMPEKLEGTKYDLVLEDGDSITIPEIPSTVSVLGEVYDSSSMLYEEDRKASYFIEQVGGFNKTADRNSIYLIRANGTILSSDRHNVASLILFRGDTIIVPQRIEAPFDWGKWWTGTLDVLFKTATTYAIIVAATK